MAITRVLGATGVAATVPTTVGGTGSTATTFANLTSNVTGPLPVANGGTGIAIGFENGEIKLPYFFA